MVLRDLYDGKFAAYFASLGDRDLLWLFVHVPKTAGSSFNAELKPLLRPNHHVFIDYAETETRPYHQLYDEAVDRFIAEAQQHAQGPDALRYATGHINGAQVERIQAAVARVRPVTLMRQPVSRFVSDYRYQRSSMHPGNEKFRRDFPTIEDYLGQKGEWNKTATYLIPPELRHAGDEQACIEHVLQRYAFVGIQEMYPLSLRMVTTLAGTAAIADEVAYFGKSYPILYMPDQDWITAISRRIGGAQSAFLTMTQQQYLYQFLYLTKR